MINLQCCNTTCKYCNTESKVNDTENFYEVQSTPTPRGHTQRMRRISTDQILQTPINLCKERLLILQLPQCV